MGIAAMDRTHIDSDRNETQAKLNEEMNENGLHQESRTFLPKGEEET